MKYRAVYWGKPGRSSAAGYLNIIYRGNLLYVSSRGEVSPMLVVAGMIGGYMALNIGANDVANNVGPAVGSRALTWVGEALDQRDRVGVRGLHGVTGFMD